MGKREDSAPPSEAEESSGAEEPSGAPKKKKRKRRRKKKGPRREAKASAGDPSEASSDEASSDEASSDAEPKRRTPWIALTILVIGLAELFVFGSRGRIEVCVAMEGVHDFALVGQPRTEENTKRYPSCERRMNVGMRSNYEDAKKDAVMHACRRANMFRGNKAIAICMAELTGWKHRVTTEYVPPWDPAFRKRLFWFAQ